MATHHFLYDDACPMCKGYTGLFTHLKWSDRKAFSKLKTGELPTLDLDRGRHEIPLVNFATNEVRYGLDAMITVISDALPHLKPLLRHPFFIAALKPLYWLITYNRRVIAGTKPPATGFDCAPDYHVGWRWTYVTLMLVLIMLIGLPNLALATGMALVLLAGMLLHEDRLNFLGHFVTILFLVVVVRAIIPGTTGMLASYLVAAWEGWRRW